jgi:integrase
MKTKAGKFPLAVKVGSAVVKVYREVKPSGTYYRVGYYLGGKRHWEHRDCETLEKAKATAQAKAAQLSRGDVDAAQLTGKDRLIYGRALEALRPLGIALDTAAIEYADTVKLLGGAKPAEAARFYMRHHGHGIKPKPVAEAVTEMIAAKSEKGVSATYLADLRYRLKGLAEAFQCSVNAIVSDDLREYLDGLKLAPRGFNNTLATFATFFQFCKDRHWLSKEAELLAGTEKRREKSAPVEIFTPAELAEILTHCSDDLRPCLALAAFAGLRSEEILRLDWEDIERRPGFIEIAADKAKTASRRLVPITPNLAQWLASTEHDAGRVWGHGKAWFFESQRDTVEAINAARQKRSKKSPAFAWKANALRHSFISYRLAEIQDVNRVALEAGNSPRMIFKHYRELCTPAQAATWFALAPVEAANVRPMAVAV